MYNILPILQKRTSLCPQLKLRIPLPSNAVGNVSARSNGSDCRSLGASLNRTQSHTFMDIDHEIISTVVPTKSDSDVILCLQLLSYFYLYTLSDLSIRYIDDKSLITL